MSAFTIRYFAAYRELVGHDQEVLDSSATTADELIDELCRRYPNLKRDAAMKIAVNDEFCPWSSALKDGDTVLLFPPVAGG